mgnify:CR=1 FL=1|tara:strand:+ start:1284 stop:1517 length:234 start_codon:yes stop_codon:yes gene_type:complete
MNRVEDKPKIMYLVVKKTELGYYYIEADNRAIPNFDVAIDLKNALQRLSEAKESDTKYYVVQVSDIKPENLELVGGK